MVNKYQHCQENIWYQFRNFYQFDSKLVQQYRPNKAFHTKEISMNALSIKCFQLEILNGFKLFTNSTQYQNSHHLTFNSMFGSLLSPLHLIKLLTKCVSCKLQGGNISDSPKSLICSALVALSECNLDAQY